MSDKQALLAAIRANPDEDTPRLMYADYLDEHGAGDLDRATAEFIRLSCPMRAPAETPAFKKPPMPKRCYPWLLTRPGTYDAVTRRVLPEAANWRRLVPSVLAIDAVNAVNRVPGKAEFAFRRGRAVMCSLSILQPKGTVPDVRLYAMELHFHRGFLHQLVMYSPWAAGQVLEAAHADQPLLELHLPGMRLETAQRLTAELQRVAGPESARKFVARYT